MDIDNNSNKRYATSFYLSATTSSLLSNFTTLAANANRSAVMNASLLAFEKLSEQDQRDYIYKVSELDDEHRAVGLSLTPALSKIINQLTKLVPECNRSLIVKAAVAAFSELSHEDKLSYLKLINIEPP